MFELDSENRRKELKEERKKLQKEQGVAESLIRGLAGVTQDPILQYKVATMDLSNKMDAISFSMDTISKEQYAQLTNVINQLEGILDSFIAENEIKVEE